MAALCRIYDTEDYGAQTCKSLAALLGVESSTMGSWIGHYGIEKAIKKARIYIDKKENKSFGKQCLYCGEPITVHSYCNGTCKKAHAVRLFQENKLPKEMIADVVCKCGCGVVFQIIKGYTTRNYYSNACRKRGFKNRSVKKVKRQAGWVKWDQRPVLCGTCTHYSDCSMGMALANRNTGWPCEVAGNFDKYKEAVIKSNHGVKAIDPTGSNVVHYGGHA